MTKLTNPPAFETELRPIGMGVSPLEASIHAKVAVHAGASCSGAGLALIGFWGCHRRDHSGTTAKPHHEAPPRSLAI